MDENESLARLVERLKGDGELGQEEGDGRERGRGESCWREEEGDRLQESG